MRKRGPTYLQVEPPRAKPFLVGRHTLIFFVRKEKESREKEKHSKSSSDKDRSRDKEDKDRSKDKEDRDRSRDKKEASSEKEKSSHLHRSSSESMCCSGGNWFGLYLSFPQVLVL